MTENKYGLKRSIPAEVKREVRKRCGFGCVICGNGIDDYEHVDPPFKDAKEHDPNGIALLCPNCHAKKTRGFGSANIVCNALKKPFCFSKGYTAEKAQIVCNRTICVCIHP